MSGTDIRSSQVIQGGIIPKDLGLASLNSLSFKDNITKLD